MKDREQTFCSSKAEKGFTQFPYHPPVEGVCFLKIPISALDRLQDRSILFTLIEVLVRRGKVTIIFRNAFSPLLFSDVTVTLKFHSDNLFLSCPIWISSKSCSSSYLLIYLCMYVFFLLLLLLFVCVCISHYHPWLCYSRLSQGFLHGCKLIVRVKTASHSFTKPDIIYNNRVSSAISPKSLVKVGLSSFVNKFLRVNSYEFLVLFRSSPRGKKCSVK